MHSPIQCVTVSVVRDMTVASSGDKHNEQASLTAVEKLASLTSERVFSVLPCTLLDHTPLLHSDSIAVPDGQLGFPEHVYCTTTDTAR